MWTYNISKCIIFLYSAFIHVQYFYYSIVPYFYLSEIIRRINNHYNETKKEYK